jgi:hypothetical protein
MEFILHGREGVPKLVSTWERNLAREESAVRRTGGEGAIGRPLPPEPVTLTR